MGINSHVLIIINFFNKKNINIQKSLEEEKYMNLNLV